MRVCCKKFKAIRHSLWLCGLLLTGCGFHLRGEYQLPDAFTSVYLSGSNTELMRDLRRALQSSGAQVVIQATEATAVLKIVKETNQQRVISLDSKGRAREYELHLRVTYSVDGKGNEYKLEERKLDLSRDYVFDSEAVLGNDREQAILVRDMQRDAARLILLQLQASRTQQTEKMTSESPAAAETAPEIK